MNLNEAINRILNSKMTKEQKSLLLDDNLEYSYSEIFTALSDNIEEFKANLFKIDKDKYKKIMASDIDEVAVLNQAEKDVAKEVAETLIESISFDEPETPKSVLKLELILGEYNQSKESKKGREIGLRQGKEKFYKTPDGFLSISEKIDADKSKEVVEEMEAILCSFGELPDRWTVFFFKYKDEYISIIKV